MSADGATRLLPELNSPTASDMFDLTTPPPTSAMPLADENEIAAKTSLTAFAMLWAVAELFHLLTFGVWIYEPVGILLFLATIALLLRPWSVGLLVLMCALDSTYVVIRSPGTANHILFNAMVSATVVTTVLLWRLGGNQRRISTLLFYLGRFVRVELLLLYFFAAFHKLNTDYFRADVSCAGHLLAELAERFTAIPVTPLTTQFSIWGTILIEAAIPLLLLSRHSRWWGIALGWGFHLALGLHPHQGLFSFSAMLYAIYVLFLPPACLVELRNSLLAIVSSAKTKNIVDRLRRRIVYLIGILALGGALVAAGVLASGVDLRSLRGSALVVGGVLFFFYALAYGGLLMVIRRRAAGPLPTDTGNHRLPMVFASVWIGVVAVNGFAPYFGLQTTRVLSMFSNLRTEGDHPNHYLVPASWKVAGFQDDLVEVIASTDPYLQLAAEQGAVIPHFELRRRLSRQDRPLQVKFRRDGADVEVDTRAESVSGEFDPVPWWQGKILKFRAIDPQGPAGCRW